MRYGFFETGRTAKTMTNVTKKERKVQTSKIRNEK